MSNEDEKPEGGVEEAQARREDRSEAEEDRQGGTCLLWKMHGSRMRRVCGSKQLQGKLNNGKMETESGWGYGGLAFTDQCYSQLCLY